MPDWFTANAPKPATPSAPSGNWFAQNAPKAPDDQPSAFDAAKRYFGQALVSLNPANIARSVTDLLQMHQSPGSLFDDATRAATAAKEGRIGDAYSAALDAAIPVGVLKPQPILQATKQQAEFSRDRLAKADAAFKAGETVEGLRHAIPALVPIFGPRMAEAGDAFDKGDYASGWGILTDLGVQLAGPKALKEVGKRIPEVRIGPKMTPSNPDVAEAVSFVRDNGVPMDAALATGNRGVAAVQHVVDRSLGGSMVAGPADAQQAKGFATLGEQLAAKGYPSAVTKETAGLDLEQALKGAATREGATATTNYDALRAIEADPKNIRRVTTGMRTETSGVLGADGKPIVRHVPIVKEVPLGVDVASEQPGLQPLYDRLYRESQLTPSAMMGDKARALTAIDRIMKADGVMPLSAVDDALSSLKQFIRDGSNPDFPSEGRAAIKQVVSKLDGAVQRAAAQAGPDAVRALREGRAATIRKYERLDTLEELNKEPVRTINALTAPGNGNIAKLRRIAAVAPDEMPKIGRAWLDEQLQTATADGGFAKADRLYADWQKLGSGTKQILWRDPAYVESLDKFFLAAKEAAKNPNPSGTAHTVLTWEQGKMLLSNPLTGIPLQMGAAGLSNFLHSQRGVELLTQGLRVKVGSPAAAKAMADLVRHADGVWHPMAIPAAAGRDEDYGVPIR